jgi:hypothetical protein
MAPRRRREVSWVSSACAVRLWVQTWGFGRAWLAVAGGGAEDGMYTELWNHCAGPLVTLPSVGDKVYYFPQGHIEQVHYFDAVLLLFGLGMGVSSWCSDFTFRFYHVLWFARN